MFSKFITRYAGETGGHRTKSYQDMITSKRSGMRAMHERNDRPVREPGNEKVLEERYRDHRRLIEHIPQ